MSILDQIEFELSAETEIFSANETLKIYSFEVLEKTYSFAIAEEQGSQKDGFSTFNLYGIIEGKIMPLDVKNFKIPRIASVRVRSFDSAEVECFEQIEKCLVIAEGIIVVSKSIKREETYLEEKFEIKTAENNEKDLARAKALIESRKKKVGNLSKNTFEQSENIFNYAQFS